jgi:pyruvate/2-oxoglutarate dehydrogenase complex dihydrolipoamide dehydrogenase (E3) component
MIEHSVKKAKITGTNVELEIQSKQAKSITVKTDHVIAATGYRVDLDRLHFIDADLRSRLRRIGHVPILSRYFESSVPGIYFVGNAAAGCFGPLMRFVYGCSFAAGRIARHVAST